MKRDKLYLVEVTYTALVAGDYRSPNIVKRLQCPPLEELATGIKDVTAHECFQVPAELVNRPVLGSGDGLTAAEWLARDAETPLVTVEKTAKELRAANRGETRYDNSD